MKSLSVKDQENDSCGGKFVRLQKKDDKTAKKKKPKKAQVKVEYEIETEEHTRQRVKN